MGITEFIKPLKTASLCFLSGTSIILATSAQAATITDVDFLGQSIFNTGLLFNNTEVGGLSGITYDPSKNVYYSISDDRSEKAPARFYTLTIDLSQGSLGDVKFTNVTTLLDSNGQPFAPLSLDPEGIALTNSGTLFISSEGEARPDLNRLTAPFVNEFSLAGNQLKALPVNQKFLPTASGNSGIRNNLSFESLTIAPDQKSLFTATENALVQDGAAASLNTSSPSRILKYNLATGQPEQEFLYFTDPVAVAPNPAGSFSTNGLVDLLALDSNRLLSLERSFSTNVGNTIKLYEVSLEGSDDIKSFDSLNNVDINNIKSAKKELLLDFKALNLPLDNIEGLTFGPDLADGRRSLIVVSDNNFSTTQFTQILAFGIRSDDRRAVPEPSTIVGLAGLAIAGIAAKRRVRSSAD